MRQREQVNPPWESSATALAADEARWANVATIQEVPQSQLPSGPARQALLNMAEAGRDVYAYVPAGYWSYQGGPRYNVWVEDTRYTAEEWARLYTAGLGELGENTSNG
jgi:hypothetical protein